VPLKHSGFACQFADMGGPWSHGRPNRAPITLVRKAEQLEQATKFTLVVNIRAAKQLDISVPPTFLPDEVIE
jgi:hypothetical protein